MRLLKEFLRNESGATAIEYGLIIALLSLALVGGASTMGKAISDRFTMIANVSAE